MKRNCAYCLLCIIIVALFYSCTKEYSYEGRPASSGYLIKDGNNNCSFAVAAGNFRVLKNLTDSNFLTVQVYVSRPGQYNIHSTVSNGYSFNASGSFSDTGMVLLHLPGTGKPLTAGKNSFNIYYDSSVCQVVITVQDTLTNVVLATNPDHFPLADNNHWSYDDLSNPGDSVIRKLTGLASQNNIPHQSMDEYISFYPASNNQYYRKTNADYFRYASVSTFTSALNYSPSIYDDLNFLKEDLTTGDSWYSVTYSGRTSLTTQVLLLRYYFRCLDADATVQVNGKTFVHVYKIQMIPQVATPGFTPLPTGEIHTTYYAKGVGIVYAEFYNDVLNHPRLQIRNWIVN